MWEPVSYLDEQTDQSLSYMPYKQVIEACGGVQAVIDVLSGSIDPGVEALEGQIITAKILHNIREAQAREEDPWVRDSGYLSYITDDREPEYWRPYVGQSENPRHRIGQHIRAMCNNESNTLHYFILSKGKGHRIANFIRLWTMSYPSYADKAIPMILANIMEMFMARAFESLAPGILEVFFGKATYSGVGLNVVPPLLQGIGLSPSVRHSYSLQLQTSSDSEIREWPSIRQKQREAEAENNARLPNEERKQLTREEYEETLMTAVRLQLEREFTTFDPNTALSGRDDNNIESLVDKCAVDIREMVREERALVLPTGSLEARVGIVLDHHVDLSTSGKDSQGHTVPPWGIKESGFDESNLLIWPFNLQQDTLSGASHRFRPLSHAEEDIFGRFNQNLVRASNLRVILLCGPNAAKSMAPTNKIKLEFRGAAFDGYIDLADNHIQRIYVSSPEPLTRVWANNWRQMQKISELFRFASLITDTRGIRAYFYGSASACAQIIRLYDEEKNGRPKMTVDTIDPGVLAWLHRKGFTNNEDIRRLENTAGDLTTGVLMLMVVLPACPRQFRSGQPRRLVSKSKTKRQNVFDTAKLDEVRKLYHETKTQGTTTESPPIERDFEATKERSTIAHGQDIVQVELASELLDAPDQGALEKVNALANEKESALPSDNENVQADFYDTADIYEVNDLIAASEHDKMESLEIFPGDDTGAQKTPIASTNLTRSKRTYKKCVDAMPAHVTSKRCLKIQVDLLSGRFYRGYWERDSTIIVRVHTTLGLKVHTNKSNNQDGVIVRAEIRPRGEKHPNAWTTQARDNDPAIRLGFRVTAKDNNKQDYFLYPETDGELNVYRASSFVEWMAGDPNETIASRPRRYVCISKQARSLPEHMRIFIGGAYTDENGVPYKSEGPKKRRFDTVDGAAEGDGLLEDLEGLQI